MPLALTGSSATTVKDKRSYKEVQELLLLHRRYEEKAVRIYRKGLSDANRSDEGQTNTGRLEPREQQMVINSSHGGLTKTRTRHKKFSQKLQHDELPKQLYINDQDYLRQLLLKRDSYEDIGDSNTVLHSGDRAQLRLPKLEGIPPENKEIFYTTLPKMPSLPKLKDRKVGSINPHRKKKRFRQNYQRGESSTFSADNCLTIRQLPRDHFMLHNQSASLASLPTNFPVGITPPSPERMTMDEGQLWLVPFVNIEIPPYRLAKWNEVENGRLSVEGAGYREIQNNEESSNDRNNGGATQPKYKRNVHFSEFLHEIHLYSPLSTHSVRSKEDIEDINN